MLRTIFSLCVVLQLGLAKHGSAQLPPGFADTAIDGPWQMPAGITFAENGQGYVWDSNGLVYMVDIDGAVSPTPMLDIREEVARYHDHGMLGFALDPDFLNNGHVYALYTVDPHHWLFYGTADYDPTATITHRASIGRISRFTADVTGGLRQIISGSQLILLGRDLSDGFPLLFESHSVGSLVFGADGSLLATCGDGASSTSIDVGSNAQTFFQDGLEDGIISAAENVGVFRSQLLNSLSGKLIRIDPTTGDGMPDNPYYDGSNPRSARSRVWGLGLRNPFRMTHVPGTGGHGMADPGWVVIGDVGEGSWEEINLVTRARQNFGWPLLEGFEPHPDYSTILLPHPEYHAACAEEALTFQAIYAQAGQATCCADCPTFIPTHPRLAYRNRWNDITVPELMVPKDSSAAAVGVAPTAADYAFSGAAFQGDASIGGCFYTGEVYPERYRGRYFQADFRDWIRVFTLAADGNFTAVDSFATGPHKIVSLAMNPADGLLYYTSMDDRQLHRIDYGGPTAVQAILSADKHWGPAPLTVSFDGQQSQGASHPLVYHWLFGDGQTSTLPAPTHTFTTVATAPQLFTVQLVVTDSLLQRDTAVQTIVVNGQPPQVSITAPLPDLRYPLTGTQAVLAAAAATDDYTSADELAYAWTLLLHHEDHTHVASQSEDRHPQFLLSPLGCGDENYYYELVLTVTDLHGLTTTTSTYLYPDCAADAWIEFAYLRVQQLAPDRYRIDWQTRREVAVTSFRIEAGATATDFQEVATVLAANRLHGTSYTTELTVAGDAGVFWRLRAINEQPAFRLSPVTIVETGSASEFARILRNPVTRELRLAFSTAVSTRSRLWLYDATGRTVRYTFQNASIGNEQEIGLDMTGLPGGVYYFRLEDGPRVQWGRCLKI